MSIEDPEFLRVVASNMISGCFSPQDRERTFGIADRLQELEEADGVDLAAKLEEFTGASYELLLKQAEANLASANAEIESLKHAVANAEAHDRGCERH